MGLLWLQQRRERIAERLRALQELVPNTNKVSTLHIMLLEKYKARRIVTICLFACLEELFLLF